VLPPARYDHQPSMPIVEHILSFEQVTAICGQRWGLDRTYLGCADGSSGKCVVYRVDDDRVRRHEQAHCNGWPSNHIVVAQKPASPWHKEVAETKPWPTNTPDVVSLTVKSGLIADAIRRAGATR
jgi:hypothetical protein